MSKSGKTTKIKMHTFDLFLKKEKKEKSLCFLLADKPSINLARKKKLRALMGIHNRQIKTYKCLEQFSPLAKFISICAGAKKSM